MLWGEKEGSLGLVDLGEATKTLLTKWILHTFELGESNLQSFLRYRLSRFQPRKGGKWPPNLKSCLIHVHKRISGSLIWNQVGRACARMVKEVKEKDPKKPIAILATNF
jgi:hypothetical protein